MKSRQTIDEIVEYVSAHRGPDLERRAHPKKKRVHYWDLQAAIEKVKIPKLRAYHFSNVLNMWSEGGSYNKDLAREMFDGLMQRLVKRNKSVAEAVHNLCFDDFSLEKFRFRTSKGTIEYDLSSMFSIVRFDDKHTLSPYAAVKYWIETHPKQRIREEYNGIRPWHMANAPNHTWQGEEGKKNGRELVDQLMHRLMKKYNSLTELIANISADDFENEEFEFRTSDGAITYNLSSMFAHVKFDDRHTCSPYAAVTYWVNTHPDKELRRKYREELTRFRKVAAYLER